MFRAYRMSPRHGVLRQHRDRETGLREVWSRLPELLIRQEVETGVSL
jgi:hypothetical protein